MNRVANFLIQMACDGDRSHHVRGGMTLEQAIHMGGNNQYKSNTIRKSVYTEGEDGIDVYLGEDENGNDMWALA